MKGEMMENYTRKRTDIFGNVFYYDFKHQYHRLDGPAIELANRDKEWFVNGLRHREDEPAVEWGKSKEWYYKGCCHRLDGPAVIAWGKWGKEEWWIEWWINKCVYPKSEHNRLVLFSVLEPLRLDLIPTEDDI